MSNCVEKVTVQEFSEDKSNIIYTTCFDFKNSSQTETIPIHKKINNEKTHEYIISEIINNTIVNQERLKFYFAGVESGYNIGYTAALKEFTSETERANKMSDYPEFGERLVKVETQINYIEKGITEIKDSIKDLPIIKERVDTLIKRSTWWKQYLLAPIITVVIGGILLAIVKCIFKI